MHKLFKETEAAVQAPSFPR